MFKSALSWFTNLYGVWICLSWVLAVWYPPLFTWFDGPWVTWALATIMLGMGLTLTPADFKRVWQMPRPVALGFVAQYTIMPATAWGLARVMQLDAPFAVGLILVACCPGGTASNVVTFLARANVALSVVLTMASTVLAIVMTPLLMQFWAGHYVPIDAWGIFRTTFQVVLLPVVLGVYVNQRFPRVGAVAKDVGPAVAVVAIFMIAGSIMARNLEAVLGHGVQLAIAGLLLHFFGFLLGYAAARLFGFPQNTARTVSIEVGMQNSGLAMVLADRHFIPATAAPAVFSSIFHTLLGSLCAAYWRLRPPRDEPQPPPHPRGCIHYWKCDRPAAFHGTEQREDVAAYEAPLAAVLRAHLATDDLVLQPGGGQGNHITWLATAHGTTYYVRIEDGPERDDYIEVESRILTEVGNLGLPTPRVVGVDASRRRVPFAWQVQEYIARPDLNQLLKAGQLDLAQVAEQIGRAVARWQTLRPPGFGPFDPRILRQEDRLQGFHASYEAYFHQQLERHLRFLVESRFLSEAQSEEIAAVIQQHRGLLALPQGVLVHKDLALWNILGTEAGIDAYIDWDDAISGDPMDDLSLLACFYDGPIVRRAVQGYASQRPLPDQHRRRFWLHLLRNMIVKSVIRVGAGYFERDDRFFLIPAGTGGDDLKTFTLARLTTALEGLRQDRDIEL
jgi:bile acid transporter